MDSDLSGFSPTLPAYVLLPATALLTAILLWVLPRTKSNAARFVVFAIWLRYLLSVFHDFSFDSSPIGLSWNALASIGVFALGLLVLRKRPLLDVPILPIYAIGTAIAISGLANDQYAGMVNMIVKYGYLAVIIWAVVDACEDIGEARFFKLMLLPFALPLLLQAFSVLLGVAKASETDGSASFIGGFHHEATFSVALATGLTVACFTRKMSPWLKGGMIVVCSAGILLANYRTAVVAMVPLLGVQLLTSVTRRFIPEQRMLIGGMMGAVVLLAGIAGAWLGRDRLDDISWVLSQGTDLIKPTTEFSDAEREMMSGRAYIWSEYIYAYLDSSELQHLVGIGPDSWSQSFLVYPHNTLVSSLYELGIFGVAAILFLWISMLVLALRTSSGVRARIVAAHISFLVLNMSTMPHWMIEGQILYGIICGYTVYAYRRSRRRNVDPREQGHDDRRSELVPLTAARSLP